MTRDVWDRLLAEARRAHTGSAALSEFCAFPDDLAAQDVTAFPIAAAGLMAREAGFAPGPNPFRDAFVAAGPLAMWRETYKGTDIGEDFMARFGCYCLIGAGGAFSSQKMWAWVVYMPADLHYRWHHHPAEEAYYVIDGTAEFFRYGEAPERLGAQAVSVHRSNQPHAMTTHEAPVMAYVVWRNGFETPPVLTE